jgi:hypothetical protein
LVANAAMPAATTNDTQPGPGDGPDEATIMY